MGSHPPRRAAPFLAPAVLSVPAVLLAACGGEARAAPLELAVYAAASTRDALQALAPDWEREHGVTLVLNSGSSGALARQIVAAARADVFLSADQTEMERVEAAGLVAAGTRRPLLSNRLVVVEPAGEPSAFVQPFSPVQLAAGGVQRIALADPGSVPAGRYARAWLEAQGLWERLSGRVLCAVDVRAALAAVESGSVQAGIVYHTDAARSRRVRVVYALSPGEGPGIVYPLAVLRGPHEAEARAFAAFLASPRARATFEGLGFLVPPASEGR